MLNLNYNLYMLLVIGLHHPTGHNQHRRLQYRSPQQVDVGLDDQIQQPTLAFQRQMPVRAEEPRIRRINAIVAIARKQLVAVWHVLTKEVADRHAISADVVQAGLPHGVRHLRSESALSFTRRNLDRLKLGQELTIIPWGSKRFKLPPSNRASPVGRANA